ncbi:MAG TPA: hypothetical protein VMU94_24115, partial [Streptosporangiaceae bacterium]|nr:hypothetical protein [Streptosporangiaceae bacterium]
MRNVTGEQLAQVDNPDPFASPVWRSPVHRTPEPVIWLVQLIRLLVRVIWFVLRHPLLDAVAGLVATVWLQTGWPGVTVLAAVVLAGMVVLRVTWPRWFARLISGPARNRWRWWFYRRHWHAVMTIARLAPLYRGRVVVPVLGRVQVTGCTDRVSVRLVSGQSTADFAARADGIAHGFRAHLCRVSTGRPGAVVLELVRRDALADPMPALPIPDVTDLRAEPEDGFGAVEVPSGAGDLHSVLDEPSGRAFDEPAGYWPAGGEERGVVEVVLLVLQVVCAGVGALAFFRAVAVAGGAAADPGPDVMGLAVQDPGGLVPDPVPCGRVARAEETARGFPQILDDMDQVDQGRYFHLIPPGAGGDRVELGVIAVHHGEP